MSRDAITPTLEKFLGLLKSGNLISADDFSRVERQATLEDFQEPGVLAWWLLEQKLVTRWQAHMLVSGWNHFFLAKYKLLDRVGAGGMGTVYKAWQPGLRRIVALKVLSDSLLGNESAVARFHREIQSAAALEHPNIVTTFDADCVKGKHFLVMEYVEGQDLDALLRKRGRLPAAEACEYARQAALGLAHAHGRGMVHRDIKPANLLVAFKTSSGDSRVTGILTNSSTTPDGNLTNSSTTPGGTLTNSATNMEEADGPVVKILDFGLARFGAEIQGAAELTQTGQVMGTPDYIAPEQARDTKSADHRSDIFSLGCTLFRMVTGQLPFRGATVMEKLMSRALEEAPRASSLLPGLHPDLDDCIARLLARDPARRYQSADEVALVLGALTSMASLAVAPAAQAGRSGSSLPTPQPPATAPSAVGKIGPMEAPDTEMAQFLAVLADEAKGDSGLGFEAGASTHSSIATVAAGATRVDLPRTKMLQTNRRPLGGPHSSSQATGRQKRMTFGVIAISALILVGLAAFIFWQSSASTRLDIDWPDDERKGGVLEVDGREWALSGKLTFSGSAGVRKLRLTRKGYLPIEETITLARGATVTFRPEWVPTPVTARRKVLAALKSEVERIRSVAGGRFPPAGDASRDELEAQFASFRREWMNTAEAAQAETLFRSLPAAADQFTPATISAYERRIAAFGRSNGPPPELVAVIGDSRLKHSAHIWSIAYSPDETLLAAGDEQGYVKVWNPATGEEVNSIKAHENAVYSLAISPDGRTLLTGSNDGTAKVWQLETMQPLHTLHGDHNQVRAVASSSQGDLVATAGLDQTVKIWNPENGKLLRTIDGIAGLVSCLAFSPDGKTLAVGCLEPFNAYLYDVAQGTLLRTLEGHEHNVYSLAFHPDGSTLVTGSADITLKWWDTASGKEVRTVRAGQNIGIAAVRYSPDGRTVVAGLGDGTVEFRDAENGNVQQSLRTDDGNLTTIALSNSGRHVTTAGNSQTIRIWNAESRAERLVTGPAIRCLAVSPDGRRLALGVRDGVTELWDIATRKPVGTLQGTTRRVAGLAFSPDGAWLAAFGDYSESTVRIWEVATREVLHVANVQQGYVRCVSFSPDATTFASGGEDGTVKLWNLRNANQMATLDNKLGPVHCLAYSHDGRMLAAGHSRRGPGGILKLWDLVRERELRAFEDQAGDVSAVAFNRDDKYVTAGSQSNGVRLWDISRGTERLNFFGSGPLAYSPDGSLLAIADKAAIHIYGTAHSERTAELTLGRPDLWVTQIAFTADGRHVAALAANGTVSILRLPKQSD